MKYTPHFPVHKKTPVPLSIVKKIQNEVKALGNKRFAYPHYLVDGAVKIIPLITMDGKPSNVSGFSTGPEFLATPFLDACPTIKNFLHSLPGRKFSCRVSILEGESEILPHRDFFRSLEFGVVRLHLPLKTNKSITFNFNDKRIFLEKGYLHYVDISQIHFLNNPTLAERMHLIIDLEITDELLKLFKLKEAYGRLDYLNPARLFEDVALKRKSFKLNPEWLPFPLCSFKTVNWTLVFNKDHYILSNGSNSYQGQRNEHNEITFPSIGPGFGFYFKKKALMLFCHGVPTLTETGVRNVSIQKKISTLTSLKKYELYKRVSSIVEGKLSNGKRYLNDLENSDTFVLLDDESYNVWKTLLHPHSGDSVESKLKNKMSKRRIQTTLKTFQRLKLTQKFIRYS